MTTVGLDDFKKLDLRIALVRKVEAHPNADRLYVITVEIGGEERVIEDDPISSLKKIISRHDPHIIISRWGDSYLMPNLQRLASARGEALPFGREPEGYLPRKRGRSYFTYGKILFTASSYTFKGRWHLDMENSFIIKECGLEGLIELARLLFVHPDERIPRWEMVAVDDLK